MLSHKAKYALKAMTVLTAEYGKGPILIAEIASRENIPQNFLELILLDLKNHRFLDSRKGRGGGYFLARPPAQISVGDVLRAVEGPLALLPCVSKTAYRRCEECRDERTCAVRLIMRDVREATAKILDSATLEDLVRRARLETHGTPILDFSI